MHTRISFFPKTTLSHSARSQPGRAGTTRRPAPVQTRMPERPAAIYQTQTKRPSHRAFAFQEPRVPRPPRASLAAAGRSTRASVRPPLPISSPEMAGSWPPSEEGKPLLHGAVVIALPDQSAPCSDEIAAAWRPGRSLSSLRQAAGALMVLAALAVAGHYCRLYSAGDVAARFWREGGAGASFLLPLYPKARAAENSTDLLQNGLYYTSINIGNPPRPYFLDIDTGSDLTWVQCDAPCTNCAKGPHPLYKPAEVNIIPPRDSSCQELQGNQNYCDTCKQCDYEITYADRSASAGVLARDSMQLITAAGEREHLDIVFGCANDQQGKLLSSPATTDGILGLSNAAISLPTQLANQGIISNVFGHCITTDPSSGGYMFLGDDYVPSWGITWVPIRNGPESVYSTEVQKVNYGHQELSVRRQASKLTQVIFDSGTSYTYFPHEAYNNLVASLKDVSPSFVQDESDQTLPFCMKSSFPVRSVDDVKHLFEPLHLQFKKRWFVFPRTFTIPPENYLTISDRGNVCLGVLDGREIGHSSTIVIGDISLRGKLVVYDNDENQVGWVQSDCTEPLRQSFLPFTRPLRNQIR